MKIGLKDTITQLKIIEQLLLKSLLALHIGEDEITVYLTGTLCFIITKRTSLGTIEKKLTTFLEKLFFTFESDKKRVSTS